MQEQVNYAALEEKATEELPTRMELLAALRMAKGAGLAAAYDELGRLIKLNGDTTGRVCVVCLTPAGQVTLERVFPKGSAEDLGNGQPFICLRGKCSVQQSIALLRPFKRANLQMGTRRLTSPGKALQWVRNVDGNLTQEYAPTPREHSRRKIARQQQSASRRANRGR